MTLGIVGIIIENRNEAAVKVNEILTRHSDRILGRFGMPKAEKSIITLLLDKSSSEAANLLADLQSVKSVQLMSCFTS